MERNATKFKAGQRRAAPAPLIHCSLFGGVRMHAFFCTPLRFVLAVASLVVCAKAAQASVEITAGATKNMSCSAGVCSPTAKKAVLNVNDLTNMLAAGDVKITTGAGAVTITVESPFSWKIGRASCRERV